MSWRETTWCWDFTQPLTIPMVGTLQTKIIPGQGLLLTINTVHIRLRRGGEILHLSAMRRSKLKKILQAWHVPYWLRDQLPLIFIDDQLVGVVGYFLNQDYCVHSKDTGRVIVMTPIRTCT